MCYTFVRGIKMKISEPKIKNCEVSSFNECVKNEEQIIHLTNAFLKI